MTAQKKNAVIKSSARVRFGRAVLVYFLLIATFLPTVLRAKADQLTSRSIRLGSSVASDVTTHTVSFGISTSTSIGSIVIEYCDNLPFHTAVCTIPSGLDVDNSILSSSTGISGVSISASDTTSNKIVLTRTPSVVSSGQVTFRFSNITNPSTPKHTSYVRLSTHASTDGSGARIDVGGIAYATVERVDVGGYVPPHLTFCVGVTVELNCSTSQGNLLSFGELSKTNANVLTSQFSAATNDLSGYNIYISGGTMTAGNSVIPQLADNASNQVGTSQFGINLKSNTNPSVGANPTGIGIATVASGYGSSNSFRYNDGERLASASGPTEFNRFTVSYLVNISADQRPGVYASSFTFTAIASF